jgi:predicted RNA-binding protein YlxR (DUF448 family)
MKMKMLERKSIVCNKKKKKKHEKRKKWEKRPKVNLILTSQIFDIEPLN